MLNTDGLSNAEIAVFGGTGYLASIIRIKIISKKINLFFFEKKTSKNYINYLSFKKNLKTLKILTT